MGVEDGAATWGMGAGLVSSDIVGRQGPRGTNGTRLWSRTLPTPTVGAAKMRARPGLGG